MKTLQVIWNVSSAYNIIYKVLKNFETVIRLIKMIIKNGII